jgi:hypothetical protein
VQHPAQREREHHLGELPRRPHHLRLFILIPLIFIAMMVTMTMMVVVMVVVMAVTRREREEE